MRWSQGRGWQGDGENLAGAGLPGLRLRDQTPTLLALGEGPSWAPLCPPLEDSTERGNPTRDSPQVPVTHGAWLSSSVKGRLQGLGPAAAEAAGVDHDPLTAFP